MADDALNDILDLLKLKGKKSELDDLTKLFNDAIEKAGTQLSGVFEKVGSALEKAANSSKKMAGAMSALSPAASATGEAAGSAVEAVGALDEAAGGAAEAVGAVGGAASVAVPALAAVAAAAAAAGVVIAKIAEAMVKAGVAIIQAHVAIGKATLDVVDHVLDSEEVYQRCARQMHISADAAQRLKIATDVLGASMKEIGKDPHLYAQYKQLIADQKIMQKGLGADYRRQLRPLQDLRFEFKRLMEEVQYVAMSLTKALAKAFGTDINGFLRNLRGVNNWIRRNISGIGEKLGESLEPVLRNLWEMLKHVGAIALNVTAILIRLIGSIYGDEQLKNGKVNIQNLSKAFEHLGNTVNTVLGWIEKLTKFFADHPILVKMLLGSAAGAMIGGPHGAAVGAEIGFGWGAAEWLSKLKIPSQVIEQASPAGEMWPPNATPEAATEKPNRPAPVFDKLIPSHPRALNPYARNAYRAQTELAARRAGAPVSIHAQTSIAVTVNRTNASAKEIAETTASKVKEATGHLTRKLAEFAPTYA